MPKQKYCSELKMLDLCYRFLLNRNDFFRTVRMTKEEIVGLLESVATTGLVKNLEGLTPDDLSLPIDLKQRSLIHHAAEQGFIMQVIWLLERNPALLHQKDSMGLTALVWASIGGHDRILQLLIDRGADLTIYTNSPGKIFHGYTALHWAIKNKQDACESLLRKIFAKKTAPFEHLTPATSGDPASLINLDPDLLGIPLEKDNLHSLIHFAAKKGHLELTQFILEKKPELLDQSDHAGQSALIWAAACGKEALLHYLIAKGADLNVLTINPEVSEHGYSALRWAKVNHHEACASLLEQAYLSRVKKWQIETPDSLTLSEESYWPIFLKALKFGSLTSLSYLSEQVFDFCSLSEERQLICLLIATKSKDHECIRFFLDKHFNLVYKMTEKGQNYLEFATAHSYLSFDFFLNNGPDLTKLSPSDQLRFFEAAIQLKAFEFSQLFFDKNKGLFEDQLENGLSLLIWAIDKGYSHLVSSLLESSEEVNKVINAPTTSFHNKTPLIIAKEEGFKDIENLLILKLLSQEYKEETLSLIKTGEQAFDLLALDPQIMPYLLANARINTMMVNHTKAQSDEAQKTVYLESKRKKRPLSCFFVPEMNENKISAVTVYKPNQILGQGKYGMVREFLNQNEMPTTASSSTPKSIAVKTHSKENKEQTKKECQTMCLAYPNTIHALFNFSNSRTVMPHLKGEPLRNYLNRKRIFSLNQWLEITFYLALGLEKVHRQGIIHGDIHSENILVDDNEQQMTICYIDFGMSYKKDDQQATTLPHAGNFYAPERSDHRARGLKPHANQDVYHFAAFLNNIMKAFSRARRLTESYPFIKDFLTQALDNEPAKRPELKVLYVNLALKLDELNMKPPIGAKSFYDLSQQVLPKEPLEAENSSSTMAACSSSSCS